MTMLHDGEPSVITICPTYEIFSLWIHSFTPPPPPIIIIMSCHYMYSSADGGWCGARNRVINTPLCDLPTPASTAPAKGSSADTVFWKRMPVEIIQRDTDRTKSYFEVRLMGKRDAAGRFEVRNKQQCV